MNEINTVLGTKCANGNFTFSLAPCSSKIIVLSPCAYVHSAAVSVALHAIVVSADETDLDWISTCAALCGCAERTRVSAAVGEAPASRRKRKSDERRVSLPAPSFLAIVSVKKSRNAALPVAEPDFKSKLWSSC